MIVFGRRRGQAPPAPDQRPGRAGGSVRRHVPLIDLALSNFANASYLKIVVLAQYKSRSLDRHISQTWRFSAMLDDYITPVPAQMRRGPYWFQGSADAIYQNLNLISDESPDIVAVFGADHIYRIDPRQIVDEHRDSGAGVTVAAIPVPKHEATDFGVIEVDDTGKILQFHEKVADPPTMPGNDQMCLASMGNYVFDTQTLIDVVTPRENQYTDLGSHVIPALTSAGVARVYDFSKNVIPGQDDREKGYWRDVGTLDSFFHANMDLIAPVPVFNLYNERWPVYTSRGRFPRPRCRTDRGGEPSFVDGSLLCQGSIVSGSRVERSIVGPAPTSTTMRTSPTRSSSLTSASAPGCGCIAASSTRTSSSPTGRGSASNSTPTASVSPSATKASS